jgi:hypothetical protein
MYNTIKTQYKIYMFKDAWVQEKIIFTRWGCGILYVVTLLRTTILTLISLNGRMYSKLEKRWKEVVMS